MSHYAQVQYCLSVKRKFPDYFRNKKVIDFGSLDINGSNREFFDNCDYTGVDIGAGRNVDVISRAHEFAAPDQTYDVVVSTEMFEHDKYLALSIPNMLRVLKSNGLFFFTCAGPGREEHGTRRSEPSASPLTATVSDWEDFYENVDETMIRNIIDVDAVFSEYEFNVDGLDFRFYGIKR